jgi:hypothetical protein
MIDSSLDRDEVSAWPDGIVFEHIFNRNRLAFLNGKLIDLTHSKMMSFLFTDTSLELGFAFWMKVKTNEPTYHYDLQSKRRGGENDNRDQSVPWIELEG